MKINKHIKPRAMHNVGADRYLITYADLITLLLGLFVILYASGQVDSAKYKEYSAAFSEYFKSKDNKILQGGDGVLQGHKKGIPEPILPPAPQRNMKDIAEMTEKSLSKFIEQGTVTLVKSDEGLRIVLSEKLLFRSAKAEIEKSGFPAIDSVANVLKGASQMIMVDGHTDSDEIKSFQFESNWHLSAARATNVAYRLIRFGVPEYNFIIRGFGSQRPIADNTTAEGKAQNRRVEIFIRELTSESPSENGYEDN